MIVCLMGPTCSGKSTFIQSLLTTNPDTIGAIEVGKEMRRRHPPEYFNGLGAMEHTEKEVWDIFEEQFEANRGKRIILVDGQPRLPSQVDKLIDFASKHLHTLYYLLFNVTKEETFERLQKRHADDLKSQALGFARSTNDKVQLYDVLVELTKQDQGIGMFVYPDISFMELENANV